MLIKILLIEFWQKQTVKCHFSLPKHQQIASHSYSLCRADLIWAFLSRLSPISLEQSTTSCLSQTVASFMTSQYHRFKHFTLKLHGQANGVHGPQGWEQIFFYYQCINKVYVGLWQTVHTMSNRGKINPFSFIDSSCRLYKHFPLEADC